MEDSLYGRTAQVLEPVFKPAGFGEWHMTGALMTGFVAKETVISSIVTSYNMDPETEGGDAEDGGDDLGSLPSLSLSPSKSLQDMQRRGHATSAQSLCASGLGACHGNKVPEVMLHCSGCPLVI